MEPSNQSQISKDNQKLKRIGKVLLALNLLSPLLFLFGTPLFVFIGVVFGQILGGTWPIVIPYALSVIINILGIYFGIKIVKSSGGEHGKSLIIISSMILLFFTMIFKVIAFK